jgi:hypothetical protein
MQSSHETTLFGPIAAITAVMTVVSDLIRSIVLFLKDRLFRAVFLERVSSIGLYRSSSSLSPIISSLNFVESASAASCLAGLSARRP